MRANDNKEVVRLSQIIAALVSGISVNSEDRPAAPDEPGVLKVSAVSNGHFLPDENKAIVADEVDIPKLYARKGDLLISRANTFDLIGACGYVERDYPNRFLPDKLWRVVLVDGERDEMLWLLQVLNSAAVRAELKARASGTGASMKNISKESFLGIEVLRPPIMEQRAIAAVLSSWDRGIRQTTDLIAAIRHLKQGLLQQLLAGKRRYPGFVQPLRNLRLRDVTQECSERNRLGLGNGSVMAVTKAEGIVPMRERLIGAEVERYKQVRKDWFAYNPMRINIGSIARSHCDDTILVSPDYVVFRCCEETAYQPGIDPDYLDHLRESDRWSSFVASSGNGSVRVRIYYDDLGVMPLQLPCMAEQRKIATLLNSLDSEIYLLTQQLTALKTQKKGLMRKLLTGEVRVKVPS